MLLKINYAVFIVWVSAICMVHRPRWLYASEPMAALPALLIQRMTRCKVVYHEHDSPNSTERAHAVQRSLRWARTNLALRADLCVLPQRERLKAFIAETGRAGPTVCVWNTPRRDEVAPPRSTIGTRPLRFYYHGSLNGGRLPLSVLDALALACPKATLNVVGYETVGSAGYMQRFMQHASQLGLRDRIILRGTLPTRAETLLEAAQADVGLALMPVGSSDINMRHMAGASNKPFDYLAVGLMPLVSDLPDWRAMYVEPGFARACNPADPHSLADAFAWCVANPDAVRGMGERGRQMIEREWNYETAFALVVKLMAQWNALEPLGRSRSTT
jgi:glycosyltransferase involved in cell wall biosynthesis